MDLSAEASQLCLPLPSQSGELPRKPQGGISGGGSSRPPGQCIFLPGAAAYFLREREA